MVMIRVKYLPFCLRVTQCIEWVLVWDLSSLHPDLGTVRPGLESTKTTTATGPVRND